MIKLACQKVRRIAKRHIGRERGTHTCTVYFRRDLAETHTILIEASEK